MHWVREILGWVLLAIGLWLFYVAYFVWMKNFRWLYVWPCIIMGLIVFRGGIHVLKVAVAARVCRTAPSEAKPSSATRVQPRRPQPQRVVVPGKK